MSLVGAQHAAPLQGTAYTTLRDFGIAQASLEKAPKIDGM
jgi:hypothetical protein